MFFIRQWGSSEGQFQFGTAVFGPLTENEARSLIDAMGYVEVEEGDWDAVNDPGGLQLFEAKDPGCLQGSITRGLQQTNDFRRRWYRPVQLAKALKRCG